MILVSGSLAYDRIMDFPGRFRDHILPDKIHVLNVSFLLENLRQEFGGTAGNIAYNLSLLGLRPIVLAAAGHDFAPYRTWLEKHGVDLSLVQEVVDEPTAVAHIITDQDDNQITGFYPGAMRQPTVAAKSEIRNPKSETNPTSQTCPEQSRGISNSKPNTYNLKPKTCSLAIISPGNLDDMRLLPQLYREQNIPYIYDPGQAITSLSGEDLRAGTEGAKFFISNDYEAALVEQKTGLKLSAPFGALEAIITTLGNKGVRLITSAGETIVPPAKPENESDPTGAGDAFRAGFIAGHVWEWSLEDACKLGATVAVYTVEKYGTQTHTFTLTELQKRFEENYPGSKSLNIVNLVCG